MEVVALFVVVHVLCFFVAIILFWGGESGGKMKAPKVRSVACEHIKTNHFEILLEIFI